MISVLFALALTLATAACWCTRASAWTLWSKQKSTTPQDVLRERRQRLPWLANYDDQSVDSVPYGTRDLEYTTARKGVPFYPVSENPVVEVEPVQETFTGAHTAENELFRVEETAESEQTPGDRIVSGLAVDKAGRQYQAHGPAPAHRPVAGVAPLCDTYANPAMSLEDWENPVQWQNISELGIMRLTPATMMPLSEPTSLLLKGHECNVARITAFVRLGDASVAGLIFRSKGQTDYFAATLDTGRRVASLTITRDGVQTNLAEAPLLYINPSIRHEITVDDSGEEAPLVMLVDSRVVLSYQSPYKDKGRFGLLVSRGTALFDGFAIER